MKTLRSYYRGAAQGFGLCSARYARIGWEWAAVKCARRAARAANVLRMWHQATPQERHDGRLWYADAHDLAASMAAAHGTTTAQAAGVIAALSPRLSWLENLEAARAVFDGSRPRTAGYGANLTKAQRIAGGEHARAVLGGHKVKSFWRLICHAGDTWDVCVDGHAANIAAGRLRPGAAAPRMDRYGPYQRAAGAYRTAARMLGERPCDVQAVTWLAHRRLLDQADKRHAWKRRNGGRS